MLAIFKTGGKQYSVKAGQIVRVEKLKGKKGDSVLLKDVLAISESSQNTLGTPTIASAVVHAKILEQIRDEKIIVFKKRRRQNYRSTKGHRQYLTVIKIESISMGNKKSEPKKNIEKEVKINKIKKVTSATKKSATKKNSPKKSIKKKANVIKKETIKKESK